MYMDKKRCIVLIDGSNFYFKLKDLELHNLLSLDFSQFLLHLSKKYDLVSATYYIGKVKTDGSEKLEECTPINKSSLLIYENTK